ncbi:MAG: transcriptional regulator MraZ [Actinobacteria bacterium]|nr:transcriptional regulator MraZ [Actinomycetota bacterium]NBY15626.1 transcriptional regulator MraZ [Actinomycetota bacterium]
MFLGTHTPKLDEKGRLILPAKFRESLTAGLVMTKGQERCLVIWAQEQFAEYAESLRARSQNNEKVRAFTRVFFSSAFDDVADKQGRVTIPAQLRQWAGLDRELVVIGADTRIEIWDSVAWSQYLAVQEPGFASLDEEIVRP